MNREDIQVWATQARLPQNYMTGEAMWLDRLEDFAALVAAAEREACAKVVENHALGYAEPVWALKLIDTIRARGQA